MAEISWPPKSPREALFSSPSGRKKYQDMLDRRQLLGSPLTRSSTAPDFLSKTERLLNEEVGFSHGEEEDEDEETLHLKLAAIEARLKLKRLQRQRGQSTSTGSDANENKVISRSSCTERSQPRDKQLTSHKSLRDKTESSEVQVPVSPTRQQAFASAEPYSPRRFVLGIDKGLKGRDVSLKRPPSSKSLARPISRLEYSERARPANSASFASPSYLSPANDRQNGVKSFSERIAESRQIERSKRERLEKRSMARSVAFQFDKTEMAQLKAAASEDVKNSRQKSPARVRHQESFSREEILRSYQRDFTSMRKSKTVPTMCKQDLDFCSPLSQKSKHHSRQVGDAGSEVQADDQQEAGPGEAETVSHRPPDPTEFEAFSSLHLSKRILPHSFLTRTLTDKKILRIPDLLKTIKAPEFELPEDLDRDYVVFGIVASKSAPRELKKSKNITNKERDPYDDGFNNTSQYMALTLTDLEWTIDLLLFDTAFPRYYRLSEGIVIAILNPTIMPPPKHKTYTNRFSLCISSSDDKILEIGYAQDIGFCKAVRKDGKICHSWVDARKTEFCDFHVDVQVRRTQSQRMGVNSGPGTFGAGGRSGSRTGFFSGGKSSKRQNQWNLKPEGAQYDSLTQSVYYVAPAPRSGGADGRSFLSSNPVHLSLSAADLIDADEDDPFIAESLTGRGAENKEEGFRRRLAQQQQERDIAKKLISAKNGRLGAEYLRATTTGDRPSSRASKDKCKEAAKKPVGNSIGPGTLGLSSHRKAENVCLGPKKRALDGDKAAAGRSGVKKTRFITATGIKEAGRDSLGKGGLYAEPETGQGNLDDDDDNDNDNDNNDDDDELEIV